MIDFLHILKLDFFDGLRGLSRRPMRSLLSSLGIGIGVTALVTMLSISEGARERTLDKIRSLGTSTLRVESKNGEGAGQNNSANLSTGLQMSDADRVGRWLANRGQVGVYTKADSKNIQSGTKNVSGPVLGVNGSWFAVERAHVAFGRPLYPADVRNFSACCVLGSGLASSLQFYQKSLGRNVAVGGNAFRVVGVLEPKGTLLTEGTGLSAIDFDNSIFLPITSNPFIRMASGKRLVDGMVITLSGTEDAGIENLGLQVARIIRSRHRDVDDFTMVAPVTLLREAEESQRMFSLVMGAIAGLSLVVGGIGVMNVMLANIAEQTREIGLRMAVGATRFRIISLFLVNSVLLSLIGSAWGLVVGVGMALLVQQYAGWDVVFSSFSIVVAPAAAIISGVLFGLHPAIRAASLDPAPALRDV